MPNGYTLPALSLALCYESGEAFEWTAGGPRSLFLSCLGHVPTLASHQLQNKFLSSPPVGEMSGSSIKELKEAGTRKARCMRSVFEKLDELQISP